MRIAAALLVLIIGAAVTTLAIEGSREIGSRPLSGVGPLMTLLAGLVLTTLALGFVLVSATVGQP